MRFTLCVTGLTVLIVACDSSSTRPALKEPTGLDLTSISSPAPPGLHYLPYGHPSPNPLPPNTIPEPYDPIKHGPPLPNSTPDLNLPESQRTVRPSSLMPLLQPFLTADIQPLKGWSKGFRSDDSEPTPYRSIYAEHESQTNLSLPQPVTPADSFVIFAPTTLVFGNTCIEMATTHRRYYSENTTTHTAAWWDWCSLAGPPTRPSLEENMLSSSWRTRYIRTNLDGNDGFYIQIVYDGSQGYPCWNGMIYNHSAGMWESKFYTCRPNGMMFNWTGHKYGGWVLWEGSESLRKHCQYYAHIAAHYLRVKASSGDYQNITVVTPALSTGSGCWSPSSPWTMTPDYGSTLHPWSHWRAVTPAWQ